MNEKEKSMLVSEVNILRELKHPNIVRYKVCKGPTALQAAADGVRCHKLQRRERRALARRAAELALRAPACQEHCTTVAS
jgi:hypothetical protein